jgi:hypothetical protein
VGDGRILKQRSADQNARALLAENVYMLMIEPLHVVSGFGVGLLVGMTGVGGGSLMTPLLILLFGVAPWTRRLSGRARPLRDVHYRHRRRYSDALTGPLKTSMIHFHDR